MKSESMSSVVAHALTGISVGLVSKRFLARNFYFVWTMWLIVVAIAPDIDYFIPALNSTNHDGLRITHSLLALLLPIGTVFILWWRDRTKWRSNQNPVVTKIMMLQVLVAGGSHLLIDLLVGVTPIPILWPLWAQAVRLPFGILPSAGRLWPLSAYYVYHNLAIELGVMVPFSYGMFLLFQKNVAFRWRSIAVLWFCSGICMYWASSLSRPKG
jgi:inner membrane protein